MTLKIYEPLKCNSFIIFIIHLNKYSKGRDIICQHILD